MTKKTSQFLFVGNLLCLDFANTRVISRGAPVDLLQSFDDLVRWLADAKVVQIAAACDGRWSESEKKRVFLVARRLRDLLRDTAARFHSRRKIAAEMLDCINEILAFQAGSTRIVKSGSRFERRMVQDFAVPERLLVPIAESAASLLCDVDRRLVRKCENPRCILYFYDMSKNHARRWCSMQGCGNRMKAAAFLERRRKAAG